MNVSKSEWGLSCHHSPLTSSLPRVQCDRTQMDWHGTDGKGQQGPPTRNPVSGKHESGWQPGLTPPPEGPCGRLDFADCLRLKVASKLSMHREHPVGLSVKILFGGFKPQTDITLERMILPFVLPKNKISLWFLSSSGVKAKDRDRGFSNDPIAKEMMMAGSWSLSMVSWLPGL